MATIEVLDGYIPKKDLARQLDVTERTLDRWSALRTGPVRTTVGQSIWYHVDDVKAWLKAQREDRPQRRRA